MLRCGKTHCKRRGPRTEKRGRLSSKQSSDWAASNACNDNLLRLKMAAPGNLATGPISEILILFCSNPSRGRLAPLCEKTRTEALAPDGKTKNGYSCQDMKTCRCLPRSLQKYFPQGVCGCHRMQKRLKGAADAFPQRAWCLLLPPPSLPKTSDVRMLVSFPFVRNRQKAEKKYEVRSSS